MNKAQLQAIINKWWVWNQSQSQMGEAYQFIGQIGDHSSGFRNWSKEGYVADTAFTVQKCKEVKGGLAIRLESGGNHADGILNLQTGLWVEKEVVGDVTGSFVMSGASIDG